MSTFDERQQDRADAVSRLREAALRASGLALPERPREAMSALFLKTAWMGSLDADMLARVPCDEIIALADALLAGQETER